MRRWSASDFNLAGNPKKLFAQENDRAEFILGAEVTRIVLNVCERVNLLNGFPLGRQSGDGLIDVTWQVFSNAEQRVVHTTTTQGYARQAEAVPGGPAWIFVTRSRRLQVGLPAMQNLWAYCDETSTCANADPAPVADETLRIARISLHTDTDCAQCRAGTQRRRHDPDRRTRARLRFLHHQ